MCSAFCSSFRWDVFLASRVATKTSVFVTIRRLFINIMKPDKFIGRLLLNLLRWQCLCEITAQLLMRNLWCSWAPTALRTFFIYSPEHKLLLCLLYFTCTTWYCHLRYDRAREQDLMRVGVILILYLGICFISHTGCRQLAESNSSAASSGLASGPRWIWNPLQTMVRNKLGLWSIDAG